MQLNRGCFLWTFTFGLLPLISFLTFTSFPASKLLDSPLSFAPDASWIWLKVLTYSVSSLQLTKRGFLLAFTSERSCELTLLLPPVSCSSLLFKSLALQETDVISSTASQKCEFRISYHLGTFVSFIPSPVPHFILVSMLHHSFLNHLNFAHNCSIVYLYSADVSLSSPNTSISSNSSRIFTNSSSFACFFNT